MTLSQIARVGAGAIFTILVASIVLMGNQRLAGALEIQSPDVLSGSDINSSLNVPSGSDINSDLDVPSGSDVDSSGDVPSGSEIVCDVFGDLNDVGSGLSVPFPELPSECEDNGGGGGGGDNGGGGNGGGNNSGNNPKLTVTTVVVNDGGGTAVASDFLLSANLNEEGVSESVGLASGVETELSMPGTWIVTGQHKDGYVGTFSGDCDSDGKVTLAAGESKNCTLTNTYTAGGGNSPGNGDSSPTTGSGSGGGGGGGGSLGGGLASTTSAVGQVLGAAASSITACDQYLTAFVRTGKENDPEQVKRLQAVLIEFEKAEGVQITGVYDDATVKAVHAFQTKYASEILTPWGIKQSTGYVYLTTRKKVNEVYCRGTNLFPLTSAEQRIIERVRAGNTTSVTVQTASTTEMPQKQDQNTENSGQEAGAGAASQSGNFWNKLMNFFKGVRSPSVR